MADHDQPTRAGAPVAQTAAAADQDRVDAFVHPSVGRLNGLAMVSPTAPLADIIAIVRAHPEDHDACIRAIHRLWGNQVALQVSIAVPHLSLESLGIGMGGGGAAPAATPGPESSVDVQTDPVTGQHDVSAGVGPVTPHVTVQAPNRATGDQGSVTGASVEVAGDVNHGNTHVSGQGGVDVTGPSPTATGDASVMHRVNDNVAVGASAHVDGTPATGQVHVSGGASIRLRLSDVAALRIAGAVGTDGQLNQEIALEILRDPSPRVPISDDAKRSLRLVFRMTEAVQVGQEQAAPPTAQAGIVIPF
jgi:hypothetical protein